MPAEWIGSCWTATIMRPCQDKRTQPRCDIRGHTGLAPYQRPYIHCSFSPRHVRQNRENTSRFQNFAFQDGMEYENKYRKNNKRFQLFFLLANCEIEFILAINQLSSLEQRSLLVIKDLAEVWLSQRRKPEAWRLQKQLGIISCFCLHIRHLQSLST